MPGVTSITWMAVSAPPGTPKAITKKISDAIGKGFKQPDMQARILKLEADAARQHARADARDDPGEHGHLGSGGEGGEYRDRLRNSALRRHRRVRPQEDR